jgi:5-formyltetrahydrofolate cyclo-ligase
VFQEKSKQDLRLFFRTLRARPDNEAYRQAANAAVALRLADFLKTRLRAGDVLALYVPIRNEADPGGALPLLPPGTSLCLPATGKDGAPLFRRYAPEDALVRPHGFFEPKEEAEEAFPDIVLCPLLAFDAEGVRLGYGRGFYDKAVARLTERRGTAPLLVGVAYHVQFSADPLPREAHDVLLHCCATERTMFRLSRTAAV